MLERTGRRVQRDIGRLRRPGGEGSTPDATLQTRSHAMAVELRSRLHSVAGLAHLTPVRHRRRAPMAARPIRNEALWAAWARTGPWPAGRPGIVLVEVGRRQRPEQRQKIAARWPGRRRRRPWARGWVGSAAWAGPGRRKNNTARATQARHDAELAAAEALLSEQSTVEGRSSRTARCSSRSPSTRRSPTAAACADLQGQRRRHADRHRDQVRCLDDDDLVGQQAEVQERPPPRPGADDPARHRPGRHGHAGDTLDSIAERYGVDRATSSPRTASTIRTSSSARSSSCPARTARHRHAEADRSVQAPPSRAAGRRRPARSARRPTPAASSTGRSSAATTTSASTSTTATTAIDIAADYGATVLAAAAGTVTFAGWKNNGGGYQVWISTAPGCTRRTTTCRRSRSGAASMSAAASRSAASAQTGNATGPAPPLRGLARPGLGRRHARQPAGVPLGRRAARTRPSGSACPAAVRQ